MKVSSSVLKTKQTINDQDMVDTAHDQKYVGEYRTPKKAK